MKNHTSLTLLILYCTAAGASEGQVSLSHMQAHTAEFEYFALNEDGSLTKAGSWTDSIDIDDQRIVRTVTRIPLGGKADLVRTVAADKHSLVPLHLTQRFAADLSGFYHTQLQGGQFAQVFTPDGKTPARITSTELPPGLVEVNLQGLFAAALPLGSESSISIESYRGGANPSAETHVFEILGQEMIELGDEKIPVWKVHQPQTNWTYWVTKESPYLLKVEHPAPGGSTLVSLLVRYDPK
jgi:hypothetical protein